MTWTLMIFLLLPAFCSVVLSQQTNIPVSTKKGPIVGIRFDPNPATKVPYDAFIGIQYGKVQSRFQLAVPPDIWKEARLAQTDGPACPQPNMDYNEDCLYLNVFTPPHASDVPTKAYPVMAFIHGSAFTYWSSSSKIYGPDFLIPENVILVTLNYRLGAVGFLTLGSKVAPGNMGLQDTLLALQWIQDEISAFGGDPKQVTLFGQSAGSVMTQMHYLSSLSTGLFNRAIAHSGSVLADWGHVTLTEGARRAKLLAKALKCDTNQNDTVILTCMQKADIRDVVGNQSITLPPQSAIAGNGLPFVPVLDTYKSANTPFFNDTLDNLMKKALGRAKPLITGFTTDEGILRFMDDSWKLVEKNLDAFIPQNAATTLSDSKKAAFLLDIKNRYFPDTPDENKVQDLVRLFTDFMFAHPSVQVSRYFANISYGYLFSYDGSWSSPPPGFSRFKLSGVSHGYDLNYLFYSAGRQYLDTCTPNLANLHMKSLMVNWWTTFAKTGVPGPPFDTVSKSGYLAIDNSNTTMNSTVFENQYYKFWATMEEQSNSSVTTFKATIIVLFIACGLINIYL